MGCLGSIQVVPRTVPSNNNASDAPLEQYFMESLEKTSNALPDYLYPDEKGVINVRVRVHVMGIYDVNTVTQSFGIKFWIQLKWAVSLPRDQIDFEAIWRPKLDFLNNIEVLSITEPVWKTKPCGNLTNMYCSYIVQGTFLERFELQSFPLDFQTLQVRAMLWNCPQQITKRVGSGMKTLECARQLTFYNGGSLIYKEAFIQRDAWKLANKVYIFQEKTIAERNEDGIQYASIDITLRIWRSCSFYVYNFALPIFLMVLLSFVSFVMDCSSLSDKLQVDLTLILTLVAFKYATSQYIPQTSYLTYLDKYIIVSFLYLTLVTGQGVICSTLIEENQGTFNKVSASVFIASWIFVNVLCGAYLAFVRFFRIGSA